jgi:hypothetical protein
MRNVLTGLILAALSATALSACGPREPEPLILGQPQMQTCAALYEVLVSAANLPAGEAGTVEETGRKWGIAAYANALDRGIPAEEVEADIALEYTRLSALFNADRRGFNAARATCRTFEDATPSSSSAGS